MKTLISLDPSFTRTGICIIKDKSIFFETASCKIGEKNFENVVRAAQSIVQQLHVIFNKYDENYDLIHESPLPNSSMSSALYALDALIFNEFDQHIKQTYNPSTLSSARVHGRKYDKKDSQELADRYLKILFNKGYKVESILGTQKKIPHDCCEAFIYAQLYLRELGHSEFQFDNSEEIKSHKERKKLLKKKEKELLNNTDLDIVI